MLGMAPGPFADLAAVAGADGGYVLSGLAPGPHEVLAVGDGASGIETACAVIAVASGEAVLLDLTLAPQPT